MIRRALSVALVVCSVGPAAAQQTREEALRQRREEKARSLEPYKPGRIEALMLYVERSRLLERFTFGDGFYPRIGGVTTGAGFAPGVGFRHHLIRDRVVVNAAAALSTKGYKLAEGELAWPHLFGDRVTIAGTARYRYFPQEDFYGVGNNSSKDGRSNYLFEATDFSASVAYRPRPWVSAGARLGVLDPEIGRGTDSLFPSIEDRFTDRVAPGLAEQPTFLVRELFVDVDYRDEPANARSGGRYRFSFVKYHDRDLDRFSFGRLDGEVVQFFPIFDKKRVIAVRGLIAYANNEGGHRVPFYMLPTIGGADTVRGFRELRFRDENALVLNLEYRWEAFAGLDMALFLDAGEVRPDWENIDLQRLKTSYGIGFRFNTATATLFRIDLAAGGREGTRFWFKFGAAF